MLMPACCGVPGTGRDHNVLRFEGLDVRHRDLVVAAHLDLRPEFPEVLNQVVGK
jgi:hypothetical protein